MPVLTPIGNYKIVDAIINTSTESSTSDCDFFGDNSCIAFYPLDGDTKDLCGNYDLTQVNGKFVEGKFGQGFEVGTKGNDTNYLKLCNTDIFNRDSFTISMWIYKYSNNSSINTYISYADDMHDNALLLDETTSGYIEFNINNNTRTFNEKIPTKKWVHIVIVQDNDKSTIYFDKEQAFSQKIEKLRKSTKNCLIFGQEQDRIGGGFNEQQSLIGIYDQIRIFNRALTQDEVEMLYNNKKANKSTKTYKAIQGENSLQGSIKKLNLNIQYPEVTGKYTKVNTEINKNSSSDVKSAKETNQTQKTGCGLNKVLHIIFGNMSENGKLIINNSEVEKDIL